MLPWAVGALFFWTLAEYFLHRVVFHYHAKSKAGRMITFLFHGIHHAEPDDASRLVMPPLPAIVIAFVFYRLFLLALGPVYCKPFFAFFIVGYLCYDYIHYATHHFRCKGRILKYLKRQHMLHHHRCPDKKYGVSSPLWDFVFDTFNP